MTAALLGLCLLTTGSIAGPVSAQSGRQAAAEGRRSAPVQADLLLPRAGTGADAGAPGAPGQGFFRWPTSGRLTQPYGCTGFRMNSSRGGCSFFHNGIDVANKRGTLIHAAAAGVVSYVGWDPYDRSRDPAWVVIIRHAGGLNSWYAHLIPKRVPRARVGDRVRQGQLIGYMGMTGKATGFHLHFMARYGGSFVNPRRFLPAGSKPPRAGQWAQRFGTGSASLQQLMGIHKV